MEPFTKVWSQKLQLVLITQDAILTMNRSNIYIYIKIFHTFYTFEVLKFIYNSLTVSYVVGEKFLPARFKLIKSQNFGKL